MSDLFTAAPLTVSELNALAKRLLEDNLFGLWVAGEVSNLTRAASGHYYFSLKDNHAQVRCAMFKQTAAHLGITLKEGDHVELTGKISIYEARGEFQITVNEVRLKGLGALFEAYERLKSRLHAEGVFDAARKQTLPERPKRIGIVTSLAAAALRDVVSTLRRRASEIPLIVYPTPVQGAGSAEQIAAAIKLAAQRNEVDVLIVCRGGGSIEDLWSYNEEVVVRAVAECAIPVISGVGHETDFTLTDFAADVRAPTPTAAAELAAPNRLEAMRLVAKFSESLSSLLQRRYYDASQRVDWFARQLRHPRQKLADQQAALAAADERLRAAMQQNVRFHRQRCLNAERQWQQCRPDIATAKRTLETFQAALQYQRVEWLARQHAQVDRLAGLLEAVSPHNIMARGFSIVTNSRGKPITDAAALKQGQKLHIRFASGQADVRVTSEEAQPDLFDLS